MFKETFKNINNQCALLNDKVCEMEHAAPIETPKTIYKNLIEFIKIMNDILDDVIFELIYVFSDSANNSSFSFNVLRGVELDVREDIKQVILYDLSTFINTFRYAESTTSDEEREHKKIMKLGKTEKDREIFLCLNKFKSFINCGRLTISIQDGLIECHNSAKSAARDHGVIKFSQSKITDMLQVLHTVAEGVKLISNVTFHRIKYYSKIFPFEFNKVIVPGKIKCFAGGAIIETKVRYNIYNGVWKMLCKDHDFVVDATVSPNIGILEFYKNYTYNNNKYKQINHTILKYVGSQITMENQIIELLKFRHIFTNSDEYYYATFIKCTNPSFATPLLMRDLHLIKSMCCVNRVIEAIIDIPAYDAAMMYILNWFCNLNPNQARYIRTSLFKKYQFTYFDIKASYKTAVRILDLIADPIETSFITCDRNIDEKITNRNIKSRNPIQ